MALELCRGESEVYWVGVKPRKPSNWYTWLQMRVDVITINQTNNLSFAIFFYKLEIIKYKSKKEDTLF